MKIRYLHNNLKIKETDKKYIEKRLSKLEKLLEKNTLYEIEIEIDKKGLFRVEVMIKTPRNLYRAEEINESVEGATDIIVDELQQQIRKEKEKVRDLKERGARSLKKKIVLDKKARF